MVQAVTAKELSRKIGLSYNVLLTVLSRFSKYMVSFQGARYRYMYTEEFLTELKKWCEYKSKNCKITHYFTFCNAVKILETMIKEIKNDKSK